MNERDMPMSQFRVSMVVPPNGSFELGQPNRVWWITESANHYLYVPASYRYMHKMLREALPTEDFRTYTNGLL